jgi:phage terminase small subunit
MKLKEKKLIKKTKSESIGLTCQTWDPYHESVITKYKKIIILMN